ncbi:MAG TPA: nitronate monooxygenase [Acidimicrobiales bacterium]|nr:nitronate monooxygenase [Acidimicrobiales bacterium]
MVDFADRPAPELPSVIQGGMGVAVSGWALARAVARLGQLGVVSGTALETVHARRLGDGDPSGHLRRAYASFPEPALARRVLHRWFIDGGRPRGEAYRAVPMFRLESPRALRELTILANFAEVHLAKSGHDGPIGINYLEKIQMPTPDSLYGALLAGVDYVFMGAGIPSDVPRLLDDLARGEQVAYRVGVTGAGPHDAHAVRFDPADFLGHPARVARPRFVAIVSSNTLASFLAKDPATRPDGFVVEHYRAGGHNAPPRGPLVLDELGQPTYGTRDEVDLDQIAALGLPFWLAGGVASPARLAEARAAGAAGIQVGTAFALCVESGLAPGLRNRVLAAARGGGAGVVTDPRASPSGYPFKVVTLPGTLSEPAVYAGRERRCDVGLLRTPFVRADGGIGYRCPSEPVGAYMRKGGKPEDTVGRTCLCNALLASAGLAQLRDSGCEPPIVTSGDDLARLVGAIGTRDTWTAADVVAYLLADASTPGTSTG